MPLSVKLNTKGGVLTTVSVPFFFSALKSANPSTDTIVIQGVHYTLSSVELYGTNANSFVQGEIDCAPEPNYPAGTAGDIWRCSGSGKIGGALGKDITEGDLLTCIVTSATGDEAAVGANWSVTPSKIRLENITYVDPVKGVDASGQKGNPLRAFKTATAAEAACSTDDVIRLKPGTYGDSGLGSTVENWIVDEGVIFDSKSGLAPTWSVTGVGKNLRVQGAGIYTGTDQVLSYSCESGKLYFEFEEINMAATQNTVLLVADYENMFLRGNRVKHDYNGGVPPAAGGNHGALSFSGNIAPAATGYVYISEIISDYPRGTVTVLDQEGNLYMKFVQVEGTTAMNTKAVILIDNSGAGGNVSIDLDTATQFYNAAAVVCHVFSADNSGGSSVRLNYRVLDMRNTLEGSSCLKFVAGDIFTSGQTAISKGRSVTMNSSDICEISGEFINTGSTTSTVMITDGILKIKDAYIDNQDGLAGAYGVLITGGVPIFDDVTIVTAGGIDSVYAGSGQNVKVYSLYTNVAMNVNINDVIGSGLLVVDAQVS